MSGFLRSSMDSYLTLGALTPSISVTLPEITGSGRLAKVRRFLGSMLRAWWFGLLMSVANILVCVLVGFEAECSAGGGDEWVMAHCDARLRLTILVAEALFLAIFVLELASHLIVHPAYLCKYWGLFDCMVIVLTSASLAFMIEGSRGAASAGSFWQQEGGTLRSISALRIFRLFRLFRLSKSLSFIINHHLPFWTLAKCLLGACKSIVYAAAIGALIMYIFAVIGVESYYSLGPQWSGIGAAMFTLLQVAAFEDLPGTVGPIMEAYPVWGHFYVVAYMAIVSVTLMSLVPAVLTERSIANAKEDRTARDKAREDSLRLITSELTHIIDRADENQDGNISKAELHHLLHSVEEADAKAQSYLKELGSWEEIEELFDLITGGDPSRVTLSIDEFMTNLQRYKRDKSVFLLNVVLQHLTTMRRRVLRVECKLENMRTEQREIAIATNPTAAEAMVPRYREEEERKRREDVQRNVRLRRVHGRSVNVQSMRHLFERVDVSREGAIDREEFTTFFEDLHGKKQRSYMEALWSKAVKDSTDGTINFDEFLDLACKNGWDKIIGANQLRSNTLDLDRILAHLQGSNGNDKDADLNRVAADSASRAVEGVVQQVREQLTKEVVAAAAQQAAEKASSAVVAQVDATLRQMQTGEERKAKAEDEALHRLVSESAEEVSGRVREVLEQAERNMEKFAAQAQADLHGLAASVASRASSKDQQLVVQAGLDGGNRGSLGTLGGGPGQDLRATASQTLSPHGPVVPHGAAGRPRQAVLADHPDQTALPLSHPGVGGLAGASSTWPGLLDAAKPYSWPPAAPEAAAAWPSLGARSLSLPQVPFSAPPPYEGDACATGTPVVSPCNTRTGPPRRRSSSQQPTSQEMAGLHQRLDLLRSEITVLDHGMRDAAHGSERRGMPVALTMEQNQRRLASLVRSALDE